IVPGWFLVAGAPFFLLLWMVALIALNHLAGNPLLVAGVMLWIASPMIFVLRADLFVRPITAGACRQVDRLRRISGLVTGVAMGFLLAFVLTKQVFGKNLVGLHQETSLLWIWQNQAENAASLSDLFGQAQSLIWLGDLNG